MQSDAILRAHPIEIWQALEEVFKDEPWLSYEPETLLLELKDDVSDEAVDKLLAVQAFCANPNAACNSAAAFEKIVQAFCNNLCIMDVVQPPEVEEMSYAVSQMEKLLNASQHKKISFGGEVPGYVAAAAKFRDWIVLPHNLSFAQDMLDSLTGLSKDTKLFMEHKAILDAVADFVAKATRKDAREILKQAEIDRDETETMIVRKFVGALLYDPTLPYAERNPD